MALETLTGVEEIGGFGVNSMSIQDNPNLPSDFVGSPVLIDEDHNIIAFKIQDGPIKEKGTNGCQIDTIIEASKLILDKLNEKFPCEENRMASLHLKDALLFLKKRKEDREARGVEGHNHA